MEGIMGKINIAHIIALIALCVQVGCSSLNGRHVSEMTKDKVNNPVVETSSGVSYYLTKPTFEIQRKTTKKGEKAQPVYEVVIGAEPDPLRRFEVGMSQGWFSSDTFELNLAEDARVISLTGSSKDHTAKVIASLGKLVLEVAKTAAKVVSPLSEIDESKGSLTQDSRTEVFKVGKKYGLITNDEFISALCFLHQVPECTNPKISNTNETYKKIEKNIKAGKATDDEVKEIICFLFSTPECGRPPPYPIPSSYEELTEKIKKGHITDDQFKNNMCYLFTTKKCWKTKLLTAEAQYNMIKNKINNKEIKNKPELDKAMCSVGKTCPLITHDKYIKIAKKLRKGMIETNVENGFQGLKARVQTLEDTGLNGVSPTISISTAENGVIDAYTWVNILNVSINKETKNENKNAPPSTVEAIGKIKKELSNAIAKALKDDTADNRQAVTDKAKKFHDAVKLVIDADEVVNGRGLSERRTALSNFLKKDASVAAVKNKSLGYSNYAAQLDKVMAAISSLVGGNSTKTSLPLATEVTSRITRGIFVYRWDTTLSGDELEKRIKLAEARVSYGSSAAVVITFPSSY